MKKYPNEKNYLYHLGQTVLHAAVEYIKMVEKSGMTNEEFFLTWEDKLNELSVKDHNSDGIPMSEQFYKELDKSIVETINNADSE